MAVTGESEIVKLQKHLSLLRQEYTKLQAKFTETEQKLALASAVSGDLSQDNLVSQLLRTASDLYEKETFSDITVKYGNQKRKAHKLILAARSCRWTDKELHDVDEIELTGLGTEVGNTIMKWVYTDKVDIKKDETFIINLVRAATKYDLNPLKTRCERLLMSSVTVSNCIRFYQTAEDIGATGLKKYCTEIIANHWDDFKTEDFRDISASLLYDMFKAKSQYPLHMAIRHHREDIVFLYLIEFNSELPGKLNQMDVTTQELPLQIALKEKQESIAKTLINHNCDINAVDHEGNSLLHRAITEGDEFAATFLIENEANVRARTEKSRSTPLHLAAAYQAWSFERGKMQSATKASAQGMARIAKLLLDHEADPNTSDIEGRSPMHLALLNSNEPVFEVLLEHPSLDLEAKDDNGHVLLWFAIMASKGNILDDEEERSYAARLVKKGSSADAVNPLTGDSLLHMAAFGGNEAAGLFLARYGAQRNHCNKKGESPLHAAAENGLTALVSELLKSGANPNAQTLPTDKLRAQAEQKQLERQRLRKENRHRIISLEKAKAMKKLKELKEAKEKRQSQQAEQPSNDTQSGALRLNPFEDSSSRSNTMSSIDDTNNPFLTSPTEEINPFLASDSFGNEGNDYLAGLEVATAAAMSLTSDSKYKPQYFVDNKGASKPYRPSLTSYDGRLDVNAVTSPTEIETFDFDNMEISDLDLEGELDQSIITECWDKTPVHMAVAAGKAEVVKCFIDFKENSSRGGGGGRILIAPDFNLRDSEGQTPLELALWTNQVAVAQSLVFAEAEVNAVSSDGDTLLHKAIKRKDVKSCLFLLEHFADINAKGKDNMPPLQMAIHLHLEPVVDALCKRGVDVNSTDEKGHTSLWVALKSKQNDIANTLVKYNCDTTAWAPGPNGCEWSLLHRAIVENDEDIACFLIRNKCDVNSHRRAGRNGEGGVEAWDGMTPLHLACASGQDRTVQCLLETDAKINVQDAEGRTPVHIAITSHNSIVTRLLLSHPEIDLTVKDRLGKSPFAVAMDHRDRESAAAILAREPSATEQFDNKGRNYLHLAIQNNDVDSVLFLISIEVNVNSFIQDSTHRSPLHLAVPSGDEVIVRHLLLAGVQVNAQDKNRQTPLHLAAVEDKASLISILLHNGADPDVPDLNLNNALHLACQHGNLNAVRALLTESSINAEAYNSKGQNPLHVLASWSKDNAAAIFELFRQTMPEYPFDAPDAEENTALFLAYCNGAVGLCCSLLRAGAKLGTINKNGMSIFNAPVPTKKLLFRLLDLLNSEPGWSDGPNCHECGAKFNVTTRKHHCRHCGRLLCGKCSSKQMPILKYELTKPVRVCEVCFDFLTVGA